jgi:hypothetical protein
LDNEVLRPSIRVSPTTTPDDASGTGAEIPIGRLGEINNLNTAIVTCQNALELLLCYRCAAAAAAATAAAAAAAAAAAQRRADFWRPCRKDAGQFRAVLAVVPVGPVAGAGPQVLPAPGLGPAFTP